AGEGERPADADGGRVVGVDEGVPAGGDGGAAHQAVGAVDGRRGAVDGEGPAGVVGIGEGDGAGGAGGGDEGGAAGGRAGARERATATESSGPTGVRET